MGDPIQAFIDKWEKKLTALYIDHQQRLASYEAPRIEIEPIQEPKTRRSAWVCYDSRGQIVAAAAAPFDVAFNRKVTWEYLTNDGTTNDHIQKNLR